MIIRKLQLADFDQVMAIWFAGSISAHPFVDRDYWISHQPIVHDALLDAEVLVAVGMRTVIMGLERSFCEQLRKTILHLRWRYMPRMSVPFDSTGGKGCRLSAAKSMRRTMPSTSSGGRGSEEDIILADTLGECYNKGRLHHVRGALLKMRMEKNKAYAEVLRQLSTAELLDRYYDNPKLVDRVLKGHGDTEKLNDGPLTINGVQMSEQDARDYLIMQLVKRADPDPR